MGRISAAAEQEIKTLLVNWWTAVNTQLAAVTGASVQIGEAPVDVLFGSEIGQRLVRIADVAESIAAAESKQEALPWSDKRAAQILADCEAVEAWLNQGPFSTKTPEAFWTSPVGFMILRAKVWANQDQLITLSAAAEISGMSLSVLSQRMTRGQLPGYRDPAVKNPKHGRRVRLSDLHTLIQTNTDRIPFPTTTYLMPQPDRTPAPTSPRTT
ncbi:MAG: hypothetical protein EHM21_05060 [Chloroflexi bacterium]|nr:MAG: hypothetical protein EHM21_05060 [Chloroflexota bacterium]